MSFRMDCQPMSRLRSTMQPSRPNRNGHPISTAFRFQSWSEVSHAKTDGTRPSAIVHDMNALASAQAIKEYSGAIDHTDAYEGSGSGLLKSTSDAAHNGTLMQVSSAAAYRGKSLKMRAFLRRRTAP